MYKIRVQAFKLNDYLFDYQTLIPTVNPSLHLTISTRMSEREELLEKLRKLNLQSIEPFNEIGLTLSGGGFRAASFGLGCISYLHKLPFPGNNNDNNNSDARLLERVRFIGTASGGTLTGALYALYNKQGKSFATFYKKIYDFIDGETLLSDVMAEFERKEKETQQEERRRAKQNGQTVAPNERPKSANLINAFSVIYDKHLFNGATFGELWSSAYTNPKSNSHIKAVCFNATELDNGLPFRFQVDETNQNYKIGNNYIYFDPTDTAKKLKLGDILAASSCFPAGLEPILLPRDFTHAELSAADIQQSLKEDKSVAANTIDNSYQENCQIGLMDGGIADNQAINSLLLINKRNNRVSDKRNNRVFDLNIICDVSSHYMQPFTPSISIETDRKILKEPLQDTITRLFKLKSWVKTFFWIGLICLLVALNSWFFLQSNEYHTPGRWVLVISLTIGLLLTVATGWFLQKVNSIQGLWSKCFRNNSKTDSTWLRVILKYGKSFLVVSNRRLINMLLERGNSVATLALDVFMKRIRSAYYEQLYNDPDYYYRRLSCLIYEFSPKNDQNRNNRLKNLDENQKKQTKGQEHDTWWHNLSPQNQAFYDPSDEMRRIADASFAMATTLWFDSDHQKLETKKKIIATGQFTLCYNLLKYIHRLETEPLTQAKAQTQPVQDLKNQLIKDWEDFKVNPYFYYDSLKKVHI